MPLGPSQPSPRVRPLAPTEDELLGPLGLSETDVSHVRAAASYHPLCALVAFTDEAPTGLLLGAFTALGYRILKIWVSDEAANAADAD